jgi:hypothetical protein
MNSNYFFLSYAKEDSLQVRRIYARLQGDGLQPWLDEHDLLPGQDWEQVIRSVIRGSSAFVVFLSKNAVSKTGYIQKEIREALEVTERLPEGRIFILPVRLDDCPVPERLQRWHWIDLYRKGGYTRLRESLTRDAGLTTRMPNPDRSELVFRCPSDHLLYEIYKRAGRFIYANLGNGRYAMGQGHFLVFRKGFPSVFRSLKETIADYRKLRAESLSSLMQVGWRKETALVKRVESAASLSTVGLITSRTVVGLNPEYWKLALLEGATSTIYALGEDKPVYFEHDNRIAMIIMPMALTDDERKQYAR